jgi:hypothetical protein
VSVFEKPSGLQVSFWRAQRALEDLLLIHDTPAPRNLAISILENALSDRQRTELHARKPQSARRRSPSRRAKSGSPGARSLGR